jgi:hypothetical protein
MALRHWHTRSSMVDRAQFVHNITLRFGNREAHTFVWFANLISTATMPPHKNSLNYFTQLLHHSY